MLRKVISAAAILVASIGFASTDAAAAWVPVIDVDSSDMATNPGYPGNQNPTTVAAYLQDLLNLAAAPTLSASQTVYSSGVLSGLGNPATSDAFLLALHFGNSNDAWEHDGPFNVFFSCHTGCDSFSLQNASGQGNYRLYSTDTDANAQLVGPLAVPEPATLALLGLGLAGLGFSRRKRLN